MDYKNYYERYHIERKKNPKTKKGSQSRQVKIKIEKTIKLATLFLNSLRVNDTL